MTPNLDVAPVRVVAVRSQLRDLLLGLVPEARHHVREIRVRIDPLQHTGRRQAIPPARQAAKSMGETTIKAQNRAL